MPPRLAPCAAPALACVVLSALALPGPCLADASYTVADYGPGNPQASLANLFGKELLKVGPDGTPDPLSNSGDYGGPLPSGMVGSPLPTPFHSSDDGQSGVGTAFEKPGGAANWAAFFVRDGRATALGISGPLAADPMHFSAAYAVNNAGVVAGTIGSNGDGGGSRAAIADLGGSGSFVDIGTLGGGTAAALGLNNNGLVVGSSTLSTSPGDFHAFLYDGKAMIDLNTLIPPATGWTLTSATGIDDQGRIAAYGNDGSGGVHKLLLTPGTLPPPDQVPEPSTILLFGAVAAIAWRCRRSALPSRVNGPISGG